MKKDFINEDIFEANKLLVTRINENTYKMSFINRGGQTEVVEGSLEHVARHGQRYANVEHYGKFYKKIMRADTLIMSAFDEYTSEYWSKCGFLNLEKSHEPQERQVTCSFVPGTSPEL